MSDRRANHSTNKDRSNDSHTDVNALLANMEVSRKLSKPKHGNGDAPAVKVVKPGFPAQKYLENSQEEGDYSEPAERAPEQSKPPAVGISLQLIDQIPAYVNKWLRKLPEMEEATANEVIAELSTIVLRNVGTIPSKESVRFLKELVHLQSKIIGKMADAAEKARLARNEEMDSLMKMIEELDKEVQLQNEAEEMLKKANEGKEPARNPKHTNAGCFICKSTHHGALRCHQYRTAQARRRVLRMEGKCYCCMQVGHIEADCNDKRDLCRFCKSAYHHIAVCYKAITEEKVKKWQDEEPEAQEKKWREWKEDQKKKEAEMEKVDEEKETEEEDEPMIGDEEFGL